MNSDKHINDDLCYTENENLKLRTIMEMSEELSGMGSFEFDTDTGAITVSDGWRRIHGVDKRSLVMDELVQLAHIDDLDMILNSIDSAIKETGIYDIEHRIIRKSNGETRTIRAKGKVIYGNNGLPSKMYGSVQDITEQKIAEKKLKESEENTRFILKHCPNAIAVYDKDLNYLIVSDRYLIDYEIEDEDITGRHHYEVFPEIPDRWRKIHQRVLNGEVLSNDDDSFVRPDGSVTYNRWECRPWFHSDGTIGGMISYTEVTTERKEAEIALKESEEKFKSIIRFSPVGIGIVDIKGNLIDCNDALADIVGYKKDELIGINFAEFTHPDDLQKEWEMIKQVWEDKAEKYELEKRYITKNRNIVWVKIVGTVSKDDSGNIKFGFAFVEDITEKKKAEEKLKKSEEKYRELSKTKDRFFSIISHDLKSPILGFMRITESFVKNFHTIRIFEMSDMLKSINESSTVLYKMLNNLLIWSEFNQDKIQYSPEESNLTKIVDETLSLMKTEIKQKEIKCSNEMPANFIAYSDSNMTSIIFRNLLSNAVKFTDKKGNIEINISVNSENFAQIEISDNGKGIPEVQISKLFELDKYHSQTGTEGEKGSGIGLILCKEFVEKQGGKIWVESQEGEGSTFFFTLPLQADS